jgi:ABC-2 type transport system ATP-binding protein
MVEHKEGTVSFDRDSIYSYIPERPIFYDELTLWEHLNFVAAVEGLQQQELRERANDLYLLNGVFGT